MKRLSAAAKFGAGIDLRAVQCGSTRVRYVALRKLRRGGAIETWKEMEGRDPEGYSRRTPPFPGTFEHIASGLQPAYYRIHVGGR